MQQIADNNLYKIEVDKVSNRIHLAVKGFWESAENYLEDIKTAASLVKAGFTVLADLETMKTPPPEIGKVHEEAQKVLVNVGLFKTAEILPESIIAKMSLDSYSEVSGMKKRFFTSKEEAEKWLSE